MKNNKLLKFTSFVLLVAMIALILVAGTFAKYTSSATGTATATVAKWEILAGVEGEEVSITGDNATVAFNLFDTIEEENGGEELDVLTDETGKVIRIAPGTSGSFDLSIVNNSEVTAAYTIDFEVDRTDIPLQYSTDGGVNWYSNLENVTETIIPMDDATTTDIDESKAVVNVQWKWAFEGGDDVTDTNLGIEAPEITVTATLNVVQYDASEGTSEVVRPDTLTVLVDGVEPVEDEESGEIPYFEYAPGETATISTEEGHTNIQWDVEDGLGEDISYFNDNGDGTATFTIPEDATAGETWRIDVIYSKSTGGGINKSVHFRAVSE